MPLPLERVALVHDWLTGMRGGEKCLEVLCEIFPRADLFTLLHNRGSVSPRIEERRIVTSFVQHLPGAARGYRRYLPVFPRAAESFDLHGYDLVISSSHCVVKGVRPQAGALHVCYCHTPMRYIWDQFDAYFGPGQASPLVRAAARLVRHPLQRWDVRSAARVHHFIANSETVRQRIQRHYERCALVVHPPVDCRLFAPDPGSPGDYFLAVGALSGYKRVDLAIDAARRARARLLVVGQGPDLERLRKRARGAAVEFLPWQSTHDLARLYARCRALLFPGVEDFGITPLEVMASGRPVIARAAGGALETVVAGETGIHVASEAAEDWAQVLRGFRDDAFDARRLRNHAERFDRARYVREMRQTLERLWQEWTEKCA
ncbi:MAG: glycosyltransferase [Candidatus Latescibacterota bacterium]|nr:MAG: glycosyltransferase [Candidatus Latescibacterota bacterium]